MENLHAAIRAWAKGVYPLEAGAELLCRTQWGKRLHDSGWVNVDVEPGGRTYAYPRVGAFLESAGYLSGGERRQLVTIGSFLGQVARYGDTEPRHGVTAFDLLMYEALPGTDHSFIRLVMSAVGHAAGMHENRGNPLPWPEEQ